MSNRTTINIFWESGKAGRRSARCVQLKGFVVIRNGSRDPHTQLLVGCPKWMWSSVNNGGDRSNGVPAKDMPFSGLPLRGNNGSCSLGYYRHRVNMLDSEAETYATGGSEKELAALKELGVWRADLIITTKMLWGTRLWPNNAGLSRKQ
ncbi:hypothetical protein FA95DRAFT_571058 [Auriscalpium vulgare]|uniref:Uncharacterized protein n=1 Tax=Auriscalpium vulgare TaxID=40419 RepID=A0ACB8S267_9AGAM|nr:hypothetical protein FA95DRAFT_571058 [Auriscalpium vulgare]